jgi:hypothetical protein
LWLIDHSNIHWRWLHKRAVVFERANHLERAVTTTFLENDPVHLNLIRNVLVHSFQSLQLSWLGSKKKNKTKKYPDFFLSNLELCRLI